MERFAEAIKTVELLTAGRYYNEQQKETIIKLVAGGYLMTEEETRSLTAFCLNPDYAYCNSLLAAKNGLVFLSGKSIDVSHERALLEARKCIFEAFTRCPFWEDREGWIRYIRSGSGFEKAYERALFHYALGKREESMETFRHYAADCHTLSIRFCLSDARERGDKAEETRLLAVLKQVYEEL